MMQIGCNTYSLRALDRAEAFRRLAALDLRQVELWAGHASYRDTDVRPSDVAREATASGLVLRAYCIGGLFGLPRSTVDERLERALWFARELGADIVTAILDPEVVRAADALANRFGMRIAIENHWYTALARPADVRRALAPCSGAVGAAIDVGHFAFLGYDPAAVADELGDRTLHVHLKAVQRPTRIERMIQRARRQYRLQSVPPGPDDRLDGFVSALAAHGYDGLLAIEEEGGGGGHLLPRWQERARSLLADAPDFAPAVGEWAHA
jgi:sugar phosphate isomerase/epimerase